MRAAEADLRVELSVRGVWDELVVSKEVSSALRTLGECHNIWCAREVPVLMGPELASGTESCICTTMCVSGWIVRATALLS